MTGLLIQIVINAVALIVAAYSSPVRPQLGEGNTVAGCPADRSSSLVFAVVNTSSSRSSRLFSLPITFLTLGLFCFVINAGMLLLVAWISHGAVRRHDSRSAGSRPQFTIDTIVGAIVASIAISLVSTVVGLVIHD